MKRKKFQKKYIGNGGCRMKKRRIFRNLNDKEFAWVLYDVGNSAYTMLACALIPIWFKAMAIGTRPGS